MDTIVDCAGYEEGKRICHLEINDVQNWLGSAANRFVWIGLHNPGADLMLRIQKQFKLHDLAVEDALHAHQRPKLEWFGDSLFLVMHTAQRYNGEVEFGETHIFAGKNYVVVVRQGASASYRDVRLRCEKTPHLLAKGTDFVLYSIMDFIVDNYLPIINELEKEGEVIEQSILNSGVDRELVLRVYKLKRHLFDLRSMVAPVVEICNRLISYDVTLIDEDMTPYFRDIHDHALRMDEYIDNQREMLTSALEANLLLASVNQNEVMKRLAGYAAMLAVPTCIAGIYGMNFDVMPELHWRYGYAFSLVLMGASSGYLYYRFKKSGWF